jgi:hypothetical protein
MSLREALHVTQEVAQKIFEGRDEINFDATLNESARLVEKVKLVNKHYERATQALDASRARIRSRIETISTVLQENLKPTRHAAEIRAYLRGLPEEERLGFAMKNVNNAELVGAVVDTSAFLSGLTDKDQEALRLAGEQASDPDRYAEREQARKALEILERAGAAFMAWAMRNHSTEVAALIGQQERRRAVVAG